jgi:phospholipid/cholesterol/gamma-HCH transport system ATP-binding protein
VGSLALRRGHPSAPQDAGLKTEDRGAALNLGSAKLLRKRVNPLYNSIMTRLPRPASPPPTLKIVPGEPLIAFKDVRIGFDEADILRGVSFEVWPGETKVLLGESGSGKTLIMKLATGLLRPDSGRIWVMGHDIGEMPEPELLDFRRNVGFVFQEGALFDSMTVAENVAFRLREENVPEEEIELRVREALRFVELQDAVEKYPAELSGGMRRRVSIARALVDRPPIVFYDSPTAGLDPVTSQTIIMLILRGRDLQGVTSLLATHRVQDAFGLANFRLDPRLGRVVRFSGNGANEPSAEAKGEAIPLTKILVLRDGQVYFEGDTTELLHASDNYLKQFLASAE